MSEPTRPRIVVVGGGFAGLAVVRALAGCAADVFLIDRTNHHVFQPLLYEVATAALAPGQIAQPLRGILRRQKNVRVLMAEVCGVDLERRRLELDHGQSVAYDHLVLATGAKFSYFGNDAWAEDAPGLKSVADALEIRRRFLVAFEEAARETDAAEQRRLLTTVIVGAGPTGIELAGTMAEVAHKVFHDEFRDLDTDTFRVVLVEGADRVLPPFTPGQSGYTQGVLESLGVEVVTGRRVVEIDDRGVGLDDGRRLDAANVIWAAGNQGAPPAEGLEAHAERNGQLRVGPDLSLEGHPEVFAIGDLARVTDDRGVHVPALAPAATQQGSFVGKLLRRELTRGAAARPPFRYVDKGTMATIGRGKAVVDLRGLRFSGVLAWLMWAGIHILFLIGFRNKLLVAIDWAYAYVTFRRGSRILGRDAGVVQEEADRGPADRATG